MKIRIREESELDRAARELLAALGPNRHVWLAGPMGAGKTTLVSALGRELGIIDDVTSPTFSIVNEYGGAAGTVFHFDFYRIENESQALELGLDDYFDSDALCVMEWAENIGTLLPDDTVKVCIDVLPDGSREMTI